MSPKPSLIEHYEAVMFAWRLKQKKFLFTKIAQETWTDSWNQKRKNKQEWLNKGFPDYTVIVRWPAKSIFCCVELKRKTWGVVSPEQQHWIDALNRSWVPARVCYGAKEAINFILEIQKRCQKVELE